VASLRASPALSDAADLLGTQLRLYTRRLATVLEGVRPALDRNFAGQLRRAGFNTAAAKALASITPGAVLGMLKRGKSFADVFEQVGYSGRRLAKLEVEMSAALDALGWYGREVEAELRGTGAAECGNLRWAAEQLGLATAMELDRAYHAVREAESAAFYELSEAELQAASQAELFERAAAVLKKFCLADDVVIEIPEDGRGLARMTRPRYLRPSRQPAPLAGKRWAKRYASCWSVPLRIAGRTVGVMQFGFRKTYEWLPREVRLLAAAAERCALAAEKLRLGEQLARSERQVRRLASAIVEVEERERRRISRELHDETGQSLLYLRLRLEMIERSLPSAPGEVRQALAEARELTGSTISEVRRILSDLSPAVLDQLGLAAALRQLLMRLRQARGISTVRFRSGNLPPLPKDTQVLAYRLAQECCSNIGRHAAATRVNISLAAADECLTLRIEDNGVGFRVEEAAGKRESFGLAGMQERVALADGVFHLESRPGRGTWIRIDLPLSKVGAREGN
jgi:signal transduction histidine kinase